MATYRFDAAKRFGKFHGALSPASLKPDPTSSPAFNSIEDLVEHLDTLLEQHQIRDRVDSVIFRSVAYSDLQQLSETVRWANY
jgi:hypothetical protein